MTAFKTTTKDTLSTDFLLVWLFLWAIIYLVTVFFAYPLFSSILLLVVLIIFCCQEPQRPIQLIQQLKATCFGILCEGEEEIEESTIFKEEEHKKSPSGRFRFAKLLLTNQVPLMANYFEQRSQ
jgi:hypothetical protein